MISKILKIELIVLFLLTIISFYVFYYQDSLSDNFFTISSNSDSINILSYYVTSLLAYIEYYTGPWIFMPFFVFALFYSLNYSKREFICDGLNVISLSLLFLGVVYFVMPTFLGQGIYFLINIYLSKGVVLLLIVISLLAFLLGSFREKFINVTLFIIQQNIQMFNVMSLLRRWDLVSKFRFKRKIVMKRSFSQGEDLSSVSSSGEQKINLMSKLKRKIRIGLPSILKGDSRRGAKLSIEESDTELIEEKVEKIEKSRVTRVDANKRGRPGRRLGSEKSPKDKSDNFFTYDQLVKYLSSKQVDKVDRPDNSYFEEIVERIEAKLNEFRIEGEIVDILKGPVVDTFLLELGKGVKVSKVTSSSDDISGALYGAPIRIVYPMRGRTTVGIEVPRNPRETIFLDEILNSDTFKKSDYSLPIAVGKDAFGDPFVVDLAAMPHMLVAGATGAGKSVFINAVLVSLLVKKNPTQMKLILIDPKQLELALYARLPHLIMPVVVDVKTASISLLWAVQEMERRYSILKEFGVRNLDGFNERLKSASPDMIAAIRQYYESDGENYELPYIVIIVDEFADLMFTKAGKEIETNICRLAGKARAAGIHLILATQRPSVDVVTGLIKSNFPTRVSFRVSTNIDSRTILSAVGAEKLLGKGDMLYKRGVETARVHSSYVDEDDIVPLVTKLSTLPIEYDSGALDFLENEGNTESSSDPYAFGSHIKNDSSGCDERYNEAVDVVMEYRAASASMLQRRLKIGYNRAANLIDLMEKRGVVGPAQGAKPRRVMISTEL